MNVLVVEDNQTIRKLVCQVLTWNHYQVLSAGSGDEALDLLAATPTVLDLLITDMDLPGMSGGDLAARLQATQPQVRVLYMSGQSQPEAGAWYLEKPFTPERLVARVKAALTS